MMHLSIGLSRTWYNSPNFCALYTLEKWIAERKNRTLKEMMNAMLISSRLPQNLLGEAFLSANYILNKLPHKKLDKNRYTLWKGRSPSYTYLKVWECLAKVMVPIPQKD